MIETFSDLARLLDDGWRITGITADSDGDKQRFRFEVEAQRTTSEEEDFRRLRGTLAEGYVRPFVLHPPAITPEGWEIGSGFAEFLHSVGHGNLDTELRDLEDAR